MAIELTVYALETTLPPNPLQLARRLWAQPGAILLWTADGSGPSYLSCLPTGMSNDLDPEPSLALGSEDPDTRLNVPRWIGILPYEAERARLERPRYAVVDTRPVPHHTERCWWRYGAMAVVTDRVRIVGDSADSVRSLLSIVSGADPARRPCSVSARSSEPVELHALRIQRALELIREGDIYQVNLARRLDFDIRGDTLSLLEHMSQHARAPYCAALDQAGVVSTSPEMFLRTTSDGRVETLPIKGTRARGSDAESDRALRIELAHDEKEAAELAMVVDIERSDLARVCRVGSVVAAPPYVVAHSRVFHRQALVSGRLLPGCTRTGLLTAMLPSGSITGAPKIRAMEWIGHLEAQRRGLYTGALGYVTHAGNVHLGMAIRTTTIVDGCGSYFVGGGIVAASSVDREVEETRWKSVQISNEA